MPGRCRSAGRGRLEWDGPGKIKSMSNEPEAKGEAETAINIVDALRGQQEQLKRLVPQPVWISKAQRSSLSELEAQVTELRRLLTELETVIQDQLRHG
jgi:hypothetical protein